MARKLFIAGNWKMNLTAAESTALAGEIASEISADSSVELALCPAFVYLAAVQKVLQGSAIASGAQDVYWESNGAFTGQISAAMLLDIGCEYVIIGHSERRHSIIPPEDDRIINRKVLAALAGGLKVILCIGETLDQRRQNLTESVLDEQLTGGLAKFDSSLAERLVIAYEPVWAIGTGQTASSAEAQKTQAFVRARLAQLLGGAAAEAIRIQYGGSVKPGNAAELLSQPDVDGALVGGASLKAADFLEIIRAGEKIASSASSAAR